MYLRSNREIRLPGTYPWQNGLNALAEREVEGEFVMLGSFSLFPVRGIWSGMDGALIVRHHAWVSTEFSAN